MNDLIEETSRPPGRAEEVDPRCLRGSPRAVAATLLLLAGSLSAQPTHSEFEIFPSPAASASITRGPWTTAYDFLTAVEGGTWRGVGQAEVSPGVTLGRLHGFSAAVQDLDGATQESYDFVLLVEDPTQPGQPDPRRPQGELLRTSTFLTPPAAGVVAWKVAVTFATPADVVPVSGSFYFGIGMPAAPGWPGDGLTVSFAPYDGAVGGCPRPRPTAPGLTWAVRRNPPQVVQLPVVHEVAMHVDGAVLNPGQQLSGPCSGTAFGAGGIYPDLTSPGRSDGLAVRLRAAAFSGGQLVLLLGPRLSATPISFGFEGSLWVHPVGLVAMAAVGIPARGEIELGVAAPGSLPSTLTGPVPMQGVVIGPGRMPRFSNAGSWHF